MTIDGRRTALANYCNGQNSCEDCECVFDPIEGCFSGSDEVMLKNYERVFGSEPYPIEDPADDPVNHPSHYCQDGSMEAIDEMIAVFGVEAVKNFCLLNVWKYRKRAIFKNGEEDLKKSDWYMNKYVELNGRG